jgi:hypothetical protein
MQRPGSRLFLRLPAAALALSALFALASGYGAVGCTDLSTDCDLNLTCGPPPDPPSCNDYYFGGVCDTCMKASCCKELDECDEDGACIGGCVFGVLPSPPVCSAPPTSELLGALAKCQADNCAVQCAPMDQCNPVTGNGCPSVDFSCELVYPGMFVCIPPYGVVSKLCQTCSYEMPPYCGAGFRCLPGMSSTVCARYCCTDADCGATGRCELDPMKAFGAQLAVPGDVVGVCVSTATPTDAACDMLPEPPPSGGTCFGGFPPM